MSPPDGAHPPLTTVKQPVREMAPAAAGAMLGSHDSAGHAHLVIPSGLVVRHTCSCP